MCPGILKTRVRDDEFIYCDVCGLTVPWDTPAYAASKGRHNEGGSV